MAINSVKNIKRRGNSPEAAETSVFVLLQELFSLLEKSVEHGVREKKYQQTAEIESIELSISPFAVIVSRFTRKYIMRVLLPQTMLLLDSVSCFRLHSLRTFPPPLFFPSPHVSLFGTSTVFGAFAFAYKNQMMYSTTSVAMPFYC